MLLIFPLKGRGMGRSAVSTEGSCSQSSTWQVQLQVDGHGQHEGLLTPKRVPVLFLRGCEHTVLLLIKERNPSCLLKVLIRFEVCYKLQQNKAMCS